jgi:hypothetical protein
MKRKPENSIWRSTAASQRTAAEDKTAKLRELRMADEAARREAGSWGDLTVGEVTHEPTGAVFVHYWKGKAKPNLEKPTRMPGLSAAEFAAFCDWIRGHNGRNFRHVIVAWNLSKDEALRIKQERIHRHSQANLRVVNAAAA